MKFTVSSSALFKELSAINSAIPSKTLILPILENFLFEIEDHKLTITASDLHNTLLTSLQVQASNTKEKSSIAIPARLLLKTLKNMPDQPLTFSIDKNTYTIEIKANTGWYKLSGENPADFPRLPVLSNQMSVDISGPVLKKAITQTIFATNQDEHMVLTPALSGVYITLTHKAATFVATDAQKLARYIRKDIALPQPTAILIAKKSLDILSSLLSTVKGSVTVFLDTGHVHFKLGHIYMIARLLEERYPDYESAIPNETHYSLITVQREALLSSLTRIAEYTRKITPQIKFNISDNLLKILAEDIDFSNAAQETLVCEYSGQEIEIGFNVRYLIEIIENIIGDELLIKVYASDKAVLIIPKTQQENEEHLFLLMPVF